MPDIPVPKLEREEPEPAPNYPAAWGTFVLDRLDRMNDKTRKAGERWARRDVAWLAREIETSEKTLQARLRGDRRPPHEKEMAKIADKLGLRGEDRARYYAAALSDVSLRAAVHLYPSLSSREQDWLLAAAQQIGLMLFRRTNQVRSIFWLPFIMQQLQPYDFRAARLAIGYDKSITTTIPPQFPEPIHGKPSYVTFHPSFHHDLDDLRAEQLRKGLITEDQLLADLRSDCDSEVTLSLVTTPAGQVKYIVTQHVAAIFYECAPGQPVHSITDGLIEPISIDGGAGRIAWVVTKSSYSIIYRLSDVNYTEKRAVEKGDIVGLTAEVVSDEDGGMHTGVVISCALGDYYPVRDLLHTWDFVHPSILIPFIAKRESSVSAEEIAIREWLNTQKRGVDKTFTLADIIAGGQHAGILSWPHYIKEPYVILPDNKTIADFVLAALFLASLPVWAWRYLHRKR